MGEAIIPFADLKEDQRLHMNPPNTAVLTLEPSKTNKGKVSGTIAIEYNYMTKEKLNALEADAQEQMERALREREENQARKRAQQEAIQRQQSMPKFRLNLDRVKAAATVVMQKCREIGSKQQLKEILSDLGVWEAASQYVFWGNQIKDSLADAQVDSPTKQIIMSDAAVVELALDRVWPLFDVDGDGVINLKELLTSLVMLTEADPVTRAHFFFDVYDSDKSGFLDEIEATNIFRSYWKCSVTTALAAFEYKAGAVYPTHKDKLREFIMKFRVQQFEKVDGGAAMAMHFLRTIDSNNDGKISKQEWVDFVSDTESLSGFQQTLLEHVSTLVHQMSVELTSQLEKAF